MYPVERVQTNLRKGVLEWCALAVMRKGDVYGRDLARELAALGLLAGEGSLYPLLARLRESGWVETRWAESKNGPPRRYYRLTPAGDDAVVGFAASWREIAGSVEAALGYADGDVDNAGSEDGHDDDRDDGHDLNDDERNER